MALDPKRTVAELKDLRTLTGDENGAQRVAWTDTWLRSREWLRTKLDELPLETHMDEAGNVWSTLKGESDKVLIIGGHMDSVPNGGWLDGCMNLLAGLEVVRYLNETYSGKPPVTVRLVDWADEEGARFGRSLLGSSACCGTMNPDDERGRTDKNGVTLPDALKRCGVELDRMHEANKELLNAAAYLELHVEQGPVLLDMDLPLGAVLGTFGVERHAIAFHGQAAHSGSTPMDKRKDAFLARGPDEPGNLRHHRPSRRRLHYRQLHHETGHRHERRRGLPHHPRPEKPRRRRPRRYAPRRERRQRTLCRSGQRHRKVGPALADRAHLVRRRAHRAVR